VSGVPATPARAAKTRSLATHELHGSLTDPALDSMSLLNEIIARFPDAVSFAPGWPQDDAFAVGDVDRYLRHYTDYLTAQRGMSADEVRRQIFQYGPSSGIICELIARFLAKMEGITVDPRAIVMTTGCQEAMVVTVRALCGQPDDVLLVQSPCYFGIVGAAKVLGVAVEPVPEGPDGLEARTVAEVSRRVRASGRRPRALYVIPDFANPSGITLSEDTRDRLRESAVAEDLLILEDSPYGLFTRFDRRLPALKSRDTTSSVIYLGSFAKSCFPGARVGYIVADQPVSTGGKPAGLLAGQLTKIKSVITVNTSALGQAVIGGMLLAHDFDLIDANAQTISSARLRMNTLLAELQRHFGPLRDRYPELSWAEPDGGFFVALRLPFAVDLAALEESAARFGVLWTPMSLFYDRGGSHELRLAASYATPAQIISGVERLAKFVTERLTNMPVVSQSNERD
jgi:(S)-3,5-dihydroxyphenylglycine transaminase